MHGAHSYWAPLPKRPCHCRVVSSLSPSEIDSFQRFITGTIDRLVGSLEGLSTEELNWRPPAPDTNSLYAIASHVLGNAAENVLQTVCGQPVSRSRAAELGARGMSWEPLRDHWHDLRARMAAALDSLPPGDLDREHVHPRRGSLTGRERLGVGADAGAVRRAAWAAFTMRAFA